MTIIYSTVLTSLPRMFHHHSLLDSCESRVITSLDSCGLGIVDKPLNHASSG